MKGKIKDEKDLPKISGGGYGTCSVSGLDVLHLTAQEISAKDVVTVIENIGDPIL